MGKKKKECKPIKVLTLDTETRGLFGEVFRVGMFDGEKYHVSNTFKEIKNVLFNYSMIYDCHVFIHNLDFDLSKIAKEIIPNANFKNSIFINNNVTVFNASVTRSESEEENEIISQPVTLHDSNKLILGRLKDICKSFGIDKDKSKIELKDHILSLGWGRNKKGKPIKNEDEYDEFESEGYYFMNVDPLEDHLNEYLELDCISLYEVIKTLIEVSGLPIDEFMKCPTTASLAMHVFQYNYPDDYEKAISTKYFGNQGAINEKYIRKSYCGGRTEVFTPYIESGYHHDVNSLYPYTMKVNSIPYGKPTMYHKDQARNMFSYWLSFHSGGGFVEVDIHVPEDLFIPPLPLKRFNKLIFPVGNLSGIWTFEEIEIALQMGCTIKKVKSCLYFDKRAFIFKDFIETFEKIKTTSEGAKREFSKRVQNSLYGKFGMKRVRKAILAIEELEKCDKRLKEKGLRYFVFQNPIVDNEEFIEAEVESQAPYIQPHIAAYITSLARLHLLRGLLAQHEKGVVAYCDTDSIAGTAPMDENMIHDKEYGKWALESIIHEGLFLQPKTYYEKGLELNKKGEWELHETRKFKGIPKRKMELVQRDTYFKIFDKLIDIQKRQENGETISDDEAYFSIIDKENAEKKRIKFATNLKNPQYKNGEITFDAHVEITKGIILTNMQKRHMDYIRNTSKPHELKEWV